MLLQMEEPEGPDAYVTSYGDVDSHNSHKNYFIVSLYNKVTFIK